MSIADHASESARIALIDALNQDLRRKSNELFRYALESTPYVARGDEFFLEAYARLIPLDDDNAENLTAAIHILGGTPSPGVWDLGLADMNYLAIRHLNNVLLDLMRDTAAQIESHVPLTKGYPKIEAILLSVLDDTKFKIEQLEALGRKPNPAQFAKVKQLPA